jgi:hypothetical protein
MMGVYGLLAIGLALLCLRYRIDRFVLSSSRPFTRMEIIDGVDRRET